MSKLVIIGVATVAALTATAIPAAVLANNSHIKPIGPYIPQLKLATDIKEKYGEVGCLKSYFGEITFSTKDNSKLQSNSINAFSANSKSCLLVEYNKKTYTNQKWHGEFRFIWVVKDDNQGLITVTNAETDTTKGELWGSSAAYTLTKGSSENSWTTSHKYEVSKRKKDATSGLVNLIPQATSSLPGSIDTEKYWGFNPDLSKICKGENDCKGTETETVQNSYSWEFINDETGSEVSSWANNINHWLDKIFAWKEITNKVQQIKGKWKEKPYWP